MLEALETGRAYTAQSLDAPLPSDELDGALAGELVVDPCADLNRTEDATVIEQLCAKLRPRDRELVRLRYEEDLVQSEIAKRLGCSQMQVSRRLRDTLLRLQAVAGAE